MRRLGGRRCTRRDEGFEGLRGSTASKPWRSARKKGRQKAYIRATCRLRHRHSWLARGGEAGRRPKRLLHAESGIASQQRRGGTLTQGNRACPRPWTSAGRGRLTWEAGSSPLVYGTALIGRRLLGLIKTHYAAVMDPASRPISFSFAERCPRHGEAASSTAAAHRQVTPVCRRWRAWQASIGASNKLQGEGGRRGGRERGRACPGNRERRSCWRAWPPWLALEGNENQTGGAMLDAAGFEKFVMEG